MENDQNTNNSVCNTCGCDRAQALPYARAVGFEQEFLDGFYSCCQVVYWSEEQWIAWREAAREDGKAIEEITLALESDEPEKVFVKVHLRQPRDTQTPGEQRP